MKLYCTNVHPSVPELQVGSYYEAIESFKRNTPCEYCFGLVAVRIPALGDGPNMGVFCEAFFSPGELWLR